LLLVLGLSMVCPALVEAGPAPRAPKPKGSMGRLFVRFPQAPNVKEVMLTTISGKTDAAAIVYKKPLGSDTKPVPEHGEVRLDLDGLGSATLRNHPISEHRRLTLSLPGQDLGGGIAFDIDLTLRGQAEHVGDTDLAWSYKVTISTVNAKNALGLTLHQARRLGLIDLHTMDELSDKVRDNENAGMWPADSGAKLTRQNGAINRVTLSAPSSAAKTQLRLSKALMLDLELKAEGGPMTQSEVDNADDTQDFRK
jgi:hypothetical protein